MESLGHRLFKKAWIVLDPPRHLYLFSPQTLKVCANRAGLQVKHLRTAARSAPGIWEASRLIKRKGTLPGGLLQQKRGLWLQLEGLVFWMMEYGLCRIKDVGEEILLVATKFPLELFWQHRTGHLLQRIASGALRAGMIVSRSLGLVRLARSSFGYPPHAQRSR